ncbi:MAG TPA: papain-like cysteine protease family protein [Blastocatellia bacterium]|nr:papain-like cysteine protease family protein [Blastocatellia bacterium]
MEISGERRPELQTRPLSRIASDEPAEGFSGLETLDLSVAEPEPTTHFSITRTDGVTFQKKRKALHFSGAWLLDDPADLLQFRLKLPRQFGLVLILNLCRTQAGERADYPFIINVNGHEWPVNIDPHNLHFQKMSWYLPHYMLHKGNNLITVRLSPGAATEVLLRSASIMRFDLQRQQQSNWCWAAVTTSLLNFFNEENTHTQCQVVQQCLSLLSDFDASVTDCIQHSRSKACNRTFKLPDALDEMDLHFSRCNYPLTLDEVRQQIHAGVPVGVRIGWRGGGGHFVLITAVFDDPEGEMQSWLRISDPLDQAASYITWQTLKKRYKGSGQWTHSYLFHRERERRAARQKR